jgi:DNA-binding CsgD family transcriptional regulator
MELGGPSLSMMERRVGHLVSAGHSDPAIARRLSVTVEAIRWNVAKLSRTLGVASRDELAAALIRLRDARAAVRTNHEGGQ